MQKLTAFFQLVRYKNLLMVGLSQYFIRFSLTEKFLPFPALSEFQFLLFVITTILITAAGYIINDIYDVKTDSVNQKKHLVIGCEIKSKTAIILYFIFNFIALVLGIYLSLIIFKPFYSLVFVYCIFFLWRYSQAMKKTFLIGNLHVAVLTALVFINTALFDIIPHIHYPGNESGMMILKIILVYAFFSFLLTLIREFVKDLEDKEGDIVIHAKTLAIVLGDKKTKIISLILSLVVVVIILVWQNFQYQIISLNDVKLDGEIYNSIIITIYLYNKNK